LRARRGRSGRAIRHRGGRAPVRLAQTRRPAGAGRHHPRRGARQYPLCPQWLPVARLDGYLRGADPAIATQGKGDKAALRLVLAAAPAFTTFVRSRRKFGTLADRLAADGIPREQLDSVSAPAGLDIKAITPEEMALSIIAQLVAIRRGAARSGKGDSPARRAG
jgi:hypothetical protein